MFQVIGKMVILHGFFAFYFPEYFIVSSWHDPVAHYFMDHFCFVFTIDCAGKIDAGINENIPVIVKDYHISVEYLIIIFATISASSTICSNLF